MKKTEPHNLFVYDFLNPTFATDKPIIYSENDDGSTETNEQQQGILKPDKPGFYGQKIGPVPAWLFALTTGGLLGAGLYLYLKAKHAGTTLASDIDKVVTNSPEASKLSDWKAEPMKGGASHANATKDIVAENGNTISYDATAEEMRKFSEAVDREINKNKKFADVASGLASNHDVSYETKLGPVGTESYSKYMRDPDLIHILIDNGVLRPGDMAVSPYLGVALTETERMLMRDSANYMSGIVNFEHPVRVDGNMGDLALAISSLMETQHLEKLIKTRPLGWMPPNVGVVSNPIPRVIWEQLPFEMQGKYTPIGPVAPWDLLITQALKGEVDYQAIMREVLKPDSGWSFKFKDTTTAKGIVEAAVNSKFPNLTPENALALTARVMMGFNQLFVALGTPQKYYDVVLSNLSNPRIAADMVYMAHGPIANLRVSCPSLNQAISSGASNNTLFQAFEYHSIMTLVSRGSITKAFEMATDWAYASEPFTAKDFETKESRSAWAEKAKAGMQSALWTRSTNVNTIENRFEPLSPVLKLITPNVLPVSEVDRFVSDCVVQAAANGKSYAIVSKGGMVSDETFEKMKTVREFIVIGSGAAKKEMLFLQITALADALSDDKWAKNKPSVTELCETILDKRLTPTNIKKKYGLADNKVLGPWSLTTPHSRDRLRQRQNAPKPKTIGK